MTKYTIIPAIGGLIGSDMIARFDIKNYRHHASELVNFFPIASKGLIRRSGTVLISQINSLKGRIFNLETNESNDYLIDFYDFEVNVFDMKGSILAKLSSPYSISDLGSLNIVQSDNCIYLWSPNFMPYIFHYGDMKFYFEKIDFKDGPYVPNKDYGKIKLTLNNDISSIVADNHYFKGSDRNRKIRVYLLGQWFWGIITDIIDTKNVRVVFQEVIPTISGNLDTWLMGAWCEELGYPKSGTFFQSRLYAASTRGNPLGIWFSTVNDYHRFSPTEKYSYYEKNETTSEMIKKNYDEVTLKSAAYFEIDANNTHKIQWIVSSKELWVITSKSKYIILSSDLQDKLISAENIFVDKIFNYGGGNLRPVDNGAEIYFLDITAKNIIRSKGENSVGFYDEIVNKKISSLFTSPIKRVILQSVPDKTLWVLLEEGKLFCGIINEGYDITWSEIRLGGNGLVDDIIVVNNNNSQNLCLRVIRNFESGKIVTLEFMSNLGESVYLDCYNELKNKNILFFEHNGFEYSSTFKSLLGLGLDDIAFVKGSYRISEVYIPTFNAEKLNLNWNNDWFDNVNQDINIKSNNIYLNFNNLGFWSSNSLLSINTFDSSNSQINQITFVINS